MEKYIGEFVNAPSTELADDAFDPLAFFRAFLQSFSRLLEVRKRIAEALLFGLAFVCITGAIAPHVQAVRDRYSAPDYVACTSTGSRFADSTAGRSSTVDLAS